MSGNRDARLLATIQANGTGLSVSWLPQHLKQPVGHSELSEILFKHPQVQELKLTDLTLDALPTTVWTLSELRYLYLYRNTLQSLPDEIGNLTALVMLYLSHNHLAALPESIGNLANLDRLDLERNCLNTLPEAIGRLRRLRWLDLKGNRLSSLPETIGNLKSLEYLALSTNALKTLPEAIGECAALKHLNIANNRLSRLPESLGKLDRLEYFHADLNSLVTLPSQVSKPTLRELHVAANQLQSLPDSLSQVSNLRILDVSNNPLTALPAGLTVGRLNISNCTRLTALPENLTVTERLDIGGTSLQPPFPSSVYIEQIFWNNVPIDEQIAFHPENITAKDVIDTQNVELRRVMLEHMGYERFIAQSNARTLDADRDRGGPRRLLTISIPQDERLVCLSVICPSTYHQYVLRVPPTTTSCRQAAAWIAGFDNPDDYHPIMET